MPPKVISGGDNPYDIHDAKLSSSATAHESSSVTAHEISNTIAPTASTILPIIFATTFIFAFFLSVFFIVNVVLSIDFQNEKEQLGDARCSIKTICKWIMLVST